jgi:predicted anti-sigma-YlaC factor YlaD
VACREFEGLLLDYQNLSVIERQRVDSHLCLCCECRSFHEALSEVDSALTAAFAGLEGPAALPQAVIRRIDDRAPLRRPSFVPEILDFAGGAAVLVVALVLLEVFLSGLPLDIPAYWVVGALFAATGVIVAYRSYADLRS